MAVPRSPLNVVVLATLAEAPMHVYRMQQLIEQRGRDRVVNVRSRASLYQAIQRLERLGLVTAQATVKGAAHPDRTVYAITDAGRAAVTQLEQRAAAVERAMAAAEEEPREHPGLRGRLPLEEEYRRTVQAAELAWLRGVIDDLRSGRLAWSREPPAG
jgi:DNA-binding PadR family transcriptional regulator